MKVFDNEKRGMAVESLTYITVGGTKVPFEESLLSMPGATFGNSLVHAGLQKDAAGKLSFCGASGGEDDEKLALIRLELWSPNVATRGYESLPGARADVLLWQPRCTQHVSGGDLILVYTVCYVHALVVLAPGGVVSFNSVVDNEAPRNFLQRLLRREKKITGQTQIKNIVSYDGNEVKIEESRTVSNY